MATVTAVEARLQKLGELVDRWTRDELARAIAPAAAQFGGMLEYHLGWRDERLRSISVAAPSGKKLRPGLALLVCEAIVGTIQPARPAAVAVELVHNFSLVHDDIQDQSRLRRHRPTVWALWGSEQGINVGDALFALAQAAIVRERTAVSARLAAELAQACVRLAEGQFLDIELQNAGVPLTLDTYAAMIERKTGALFASACRLGAIASGASAERCDAFAEYGLTLGLAFQEQDDVLGVWGTEAETGKPVAADVVTRKRSLPAALALARADAPQWLGDAYAPGEGDMAPPLVRRVVEHFDTRGVREEAERRIGSRYAAALRALEAAAPAEPARTYLAGMCELLRSRRG
jgi:geranylgeranyl diphosphate synthase type I